MKKLLSFVIYCSTIAIGYGAEGDIKNSYSDSSGQFVTGTWSGSNGVLTKTSSIPTVTAVSGTGRLAALSGTNTWTGTNSFVPNLGIARSGTNDPFVVLSGTNNLAKTRLHHVENDDGTQNGWSSIHLTINSRITTLPGGGDVAVRDDNSLPWQEFVMENNFFNGVFNNEFWWSTQGDRKIFFANDVANNLTTGAWSIYAPVIIGWLPNHNYSSVNQGFALDLVFDPGNGNEVKARLYNTGTTSSATQIAMGDTNHGFVFQTDTDFDITGDFRIYNEELNSTPLRVTETGQVGIRTNTVASGIDVEVSGSTQVTGNFYVSGTYVGPIDVVDTTATRGLRSTSAGSSPIMAQRSNVANGTGGTTMAEFLMSGTGAPTTFNPVLRVLGNLSSGTPSLAYLACPSGVNVLYLGINGTTTSHEFGSNYYVGNFLWSGTGSATGPTHSFNADTNTGMYSVAADELGFTSGGTQRFGTDNTGFYVGPTASKMRLANSGAGTITFAGTGTNALIVSSGTFVLSSGTAVVVNANVTTSSVFAYPTLRVISGAIEGAPVIQVLSGSFIATGGASDNSTYNWALIGP